MLLTENAKKEKPNARRNKYQNTDIKHAEHTHTHTHTHTHAHAHARTRTRAQYPKHVYTN